MKFGRNVVKKIQHKNYQDEDKRSAINKKMNSLIHLKMIPIKDKFILKTSIYILKYILKTNIY